MSNQVIGENIIGGLNKKKSGEQAFNAKYLAYIRAAQARNYS